MIEFKKVHIKNFFSIKEIEFEFFEKGLTLLYGKNGHGKSVMFDAIYWCLFGSTTKGVKANQVINDTIRRNCSVCIEFKDQSNEYILTRYRKHTDKANAFELTVNGEEIKERDVQEQVYEILGTDENVFSIANMISNDNSSNILELTHARRADIFEQIFGLSLLDEYESKVRKNLTTVKKELDENTEMLIRLKTELQTLKRSISDYEETKEEKKNELVETINELKEENKALQKVDVKKLEKFRSKKKSLLDETIGYQDLIRKFESDLKSSNIMLIDTEKNLVKSKEELNKLVEDKCYVCGTSVNSKKIKQIKAEKEAEIDVYNDNKHDLSVRIGKMEKELLKLKEKLFEATKQIEAINIQVNADNLTNVDVDSLKKEIEENDKSIDRLGKLIVEIETDNYIRQKKQEVNALEKKVPKYENVDINLKKDESQWEFWKEAFNLKKPNNIKKFKISDILKKFNEDVAHYVNVFFPENKVIIEFDKSLVETIIFDGKERAYKQFSKGQRKKLNNAINFAFFDMARMVSKPIKMLIVDECADGLDSESEKSVLDMLSAIADKNAVYIISHSDNTKNSVDNIYKVEMNKGFTEIDLVLN